MTNRLADASSAYLRQHAENPVDWWPWGRAALDEASRLDRPIFLSVGYAACHWCHVMAHESFESPEVAQLLNDSFVAIKVDREERPDVDALYMAATQLVAGHGGWPMSVFLTPDGLPFMAGTYYPPVDRLGQIGFSRLLGAMRDVWANRREDVVHQADRLRQSLQREVAFIDHLTPNPQSLDLAATRRRLRDELVGRVDEDGGFGEAPKFPRPSFVDALLDYDDGPARAAVARTLDAMSREGLYDHLRGGFARYSVDGSWHVPHFEKMLCDQALLARTYLRAARVMPGHPQWREVALDTIGFVLEDLALDGGFASSLDADAGGVEGAHVTWTPDEVRAALGAELESELTNALSRWRIESPGGFEGRSIPRLALGEPFVTPSSLEPVAAALRGARAQRVQPGRDEKVILEWNAMFASALLLSGEGDLVERGLELIEQLTGTHFDGRDWWRTERRQAHATAADVAWLLDASIDAFEATGDDRWTARATALARYLVAHHWEGEVPSAEAPDTGRGIFSQSDLVNDLVARPKEIFDGATPSSHAVACRALARLSLCTGDDVSGLVARRLVELARPLLIAHPSAVPDLLDAAGFALDGVEVVVPGPRSALADHVRSTAMRRAVLITGSGDSTLLAQRRVGLAYVCRAGVCRRPVGDVAALDSELREVLR